MGVAFDTDVVIVGAGPVGLATACALAHHGVRFRIFERARGISGASKGHNAIARAQELLAAIGVRDLVASKSYVAPFTQYLLDGRPIHRQSTRDLSSPWPDVLFSNQGTIEELLSERLARDGIRVEHAHEVRGIDQDDDGVTVTVVAVDDDGEPDGDAFDVRCRYLVGADGVKGTVRKAVGLDFEAQDLPGWAIRQIDGTLTWRRPVARDTAFFFLFAHGLAGVLPVWEDQYRLFLLERGCDARARSDAREDGRTWPRGDRRRELRHRRPELVLLRHVPPRRRAGLRRGPRVPRRRCGSRQSADRGAGHELRLCRRGHARLAAGDGAGRCRHARAARQLCRRTQGRERRPRCAAGPRLPPADAARTRGGRGAGRGRGRGAAGRRLCVRRQRPGAARPRLSRRPVERGPLPRLDPRYAGSTRAGDRVPDAALALTGGAATTLFAQIYNPDGRSWGWRLLLLDGGDRASHPALAAAADALSAHAWVRPLLVIADPASTGEEPLMPAAWDLDQLAHRALGLGDTSAILLIRPDGHLAFRGGTDAASALVDHVATFAAGGRRAPPGAAPPESVRPPATHR